jgi:hypothetical protein
MAIVKIQKVGIFQKLYRICLAVPKKKDKIPKKRLPFAHGVF